jgi:hypothetical protein
MNGEAAIQKTEAGERGRVKQTEEVGGEYSKRTEIAGGMGGGDGPYVLRPSSHEPASGGSGWRRFILSVTCKRETRAFVLMASPGCR